MKKKALKRSPNIVFVMADQLGASFVGCYGSGVDSTPVLDSLAARGVKFTRCYATCPISAPNRATILTGRTPEIHGVVTNNLVLPPDAPTYVQALQSVGYHTGGFGKFHHDPMPLKLPADLKRLGYDEVVMTEDPKCDAWLDWIRCEHPEHHETALSMCWPQTWVRQCGEGEGSLYGAMIAAGQKILRPLREASDFGVMYPSPLPRELHQTTFITERALDFMRRHLEERKDQPFYAFVSYVDPHDPYDPPKPYDTMFRPEDMKDAIPLPGGRHEIESLEATRALWGFDKVSSNQEVIRKLRALFHGSIRFLDDQIGRMVQFLEQRGLMDETIFIFTTDHGEMMGDHGLLTKGNKHYDAGIRCPLIVCGGDVACGETTRLTCSLDFFPTFCDLGGVETNLSLEGMSFAGTCKDLSAEDGWDVVTVQAPHIAKTVYSIITRDGWRFSIFDEEGKGQMFNLGSDPQEMNNLYHDPGWTQKKLELFEKLVRAYMQRGYVFQPRNFPIIEGKIHVPSSDCSSFHPMYFRKSGG